MAGNELPVMGSRIGLTFDELKGDAVGEFWGGDKAEKLRVAADALRDELDCLGMGGFTFRYEPAPKR